MYDSPIRSTHTRSRDSTASRRGLLPTALIAAALAAGVVVASLDPVSIVLLVEGAIGVVAAWMLLRHVPRPETTELRYHVPGLDLDVEIAVSTAE